MWSGMLIKNNFGRMWSECDMHRHVDEKYKEEGCGMNVKGKYVDQNWGISMWNGWIVSTRAGVQTECGIDRYMDDEQGTWGGCRVNVSHGIRWQIIT